MCAGVASQDEAISLREIGVIIAQVEIEDFAGKRHAGLPIEIGGQRKAAEFLRLTAEPRIASASGERHADVSKYAAAGLSYDVPSSLLPPETSNSNWFVVRSDVTSPPSAADQPRPPRLITCPCAGLIATEMNHIAVATATAPARAPPNSADRKCRSGSAP
jgi:hypothetical protein